jgi:hypothetical protein
MTAAAARSRRTVTLRSSSGKAVLTVPLLPAAVAGAVALAVAPRITALAALGALVQKMSLSMQAAPRPEAAA